MPASPPGPSPEEVVFLGQAPQYPVIAHGNYPGRKMSLLLGEGALHPAASCSPLQGHSSVAPPSVPASRKAGVVLQTVLHQDHRGLHGRFYPKASRPQQPWWVGLTGKRRHIVTFTSPTSFIAATLIRMKQWNRSFTFCRAPMRRSGRGLPERAPRWAAGLSQCRCRWTWRRNE